MSLSSLMARALFKLISNSITYNPHHMHSAPEIRANCCTQVVCKIVDRGLGIVLHDQIRLYVSSGT